MNAITPKPATMQALKSALRHVPMDDLVYSIGRALSGAYAPIVGILSREYGVTATDLATALDSLAEGEHKATT